MNTTTHVAMMQSKRKAFVDLTNISSDDETSGKLCKRTSVQDMLPQQKADGNKSANNWMLIVFKMSILYYLGINLI